MAEIRIGRGKVLLDYVGDDRFQVIVLEKGSGRQAGLEMSREQLDTLGKAFQAKAKEK